MHHTDAKQPGCDGSSGFRLSRTGVRGDCSYWEGTQGCRHQLGVSRIARDSPAKLDTARSYSPVADVNSDPRNPVIGQFF